MQKIRQFTARELCATLEKLGFVNCGVGRHQHKFVHPARHSKGRRPYFIFPDDIGKKKDFQKHLITTLMRLWDFTLDEVTKALS